MEYIVQKGDTLTAIAKELTGSSANYLKLAGVNNIDDPDKIKVGQKLKIPEKFDKPLKKSEIPTKNKVQVIDNFSPNYNYIVEGDKVYYSKKGRDYWVDISDNDKARKNLLQFLNNKYNFKGYEDGEKDIYYKIINEGWTYKTRNKKDDVLKNLLIVNKKQEPLQNSWEQYNQKFKKQGQPKTQSKSTVDAKKKDDKKSSKETLIDKVKQYFDENDLSQLPRQGINWISRQWEKNFGKEEDSVPLTVKVDGNEQIKIDLSLVGDTIPVNGNSRRYIIPETLNLNDFTFGVRNRGNYEPIKSEAAPITTFNPFIKYENFKRGTHNTFIGIDTNGKIKIGSYDIFGPGDYLTGTYSNNIYGFKRGENGKIQYKSDGEHGNRSRKVPITLVATEDGSIQEGSLNILTNLSSLGNDKLGSTYGNISGGRVIVKAGNKLMLVSGSIEQIDDTIEQLKKQEDVDRVTVYTLDNGSYNRGLRTYDGKFTSSDLRQYDNQNRGGGNFLYIKNEIPRQLQFKSDTIFTPNIRTINSESYRKGHPLTNELQGVVLHHTGFREPDLNAVLKHLTDKNTEVSAHVVIGYNGNRVVLANPENVTFHAGASRFNNRNNVNDFMLGIEFQGNTTKKDLTDEQIKSAVEYLAPIIQKYRIPLSNIITHKQVRDNYNEYQRQKSEKEAPSKNDINFKNYQRIMEELLKTVYYQKEGGTLNYLNYFDLFQTNDIDFFKGGSKINIKKENRGKFTEYCGGKVTQDCINRGKQSKDPAIRKRAIFAQNARRFKHENGGTISYLNLFK